MFPPEEIKKLVEKALGRAFELMQCEDLAGADTVLRQLLKVDPECPQAYQLLGLICHKKRQYDIAIEHYTRALELKPDDDETLNNLALSHSSLGHFSQAVQYLNEALAIKQKGCYYSNLGLQYRHLEQIEEAQKCFQLALQINPEDHFALCMLGGTYGEQKNLDEAQQQFEKAIAAKPDFAGAHVDLAYVHHLRGDLEKAWPEYEHRFNSYDQIQQIASIFDPHKKWQKESLDGKTLLIFCEQGVGDAIHFVRYVPILRQRYRVNIALHTFPELDSLLEPYRDQVVTISPELKSELPFYDYHCSILSLPYLLDNPNIPDIPYLQTNHRLDMRDYEGLFKIGICWAGSPYHPNDGLRSCYLKEFKPLHDLPGVKLFSLQKDLRKRRYRFLDEDVDFSEGTEGLRIVDLGSGFKDLNDTAAAIKSLDLVITVDTAILHLAGALDVPTWAMIAYNPDWRWQIRGDSTRWYKSVKLFRQDRPKNWSHVIEKMRAELSTIPVAAPI